jgi:histidinol dehydrogenase
VGALVEVSDADQALGLAQAIAPEHLQLIGPRAEALAPKATHAGCVFVGVNAGTAFGDYIAGSNHILPTNGAARFESVLSPAHFRRRFTEVTIEDPSGLAKAAAPIARAEGFELHARSMESRIRQNQ